MDHAKEKLIKLFFKNIYGNSPNIDNYNVKHSGAKGHWLEKKLGKKPDANNEADFWGWELKNHTSSGKTTYGDWSANEYIFNKNNIYEINRDEFFNFWGKPNMKKNNRLSWSGIPVPRIPNKKYTKYGQMMYLDNDQNIIIKYNFSKDERSNKNKIVPQKFQLEDLILAKWYGFEKNNVTKKDALETKVHKKFNQKGWFKCIMENNVYTKIIFGRPMNFDTWISNLRNGDIFFDSGMYKGNIRPYSMWRSNNTFWDKLITDVYSKETELVLQQ